MNHYEILEVSPRASAEVIRAAYRSLIQRLHPDKSPADGAMAERASLVVQAYEVLSDPQKRSEYDLALRSMAVDQLMPPQVHGHNRFRVRASATEEMPKRNDRFVWYVCLILAVILFSGWSIRSTLKQALPSEHELVTTHSVLKREIPVLLRDVTVYLKDPDNPSEESRRVLFIPAVGVRVGMLDAENAVRHLNNTKERLGQKLRDALASATYPDLIKADGERYLAGKILDVINENPANHAASMPTDAATSNPDARDHYGVVEVLLPESYSVK